MRDGVTAVGPDQADVPVQLTQPGQQAGGRLAVPDVRGGHGHDPQQAQAVSHDVPLPPVDQLPAVEAA